MAYHGVKFKTEIIDDNIPDDSRIEELKFWCRKFSEGDLAPAVGQGSAGNLSFRVKPAEDKFIITGAGTDLRTIQNNQFAEVVAIDWDMNAVKFRGEIQPSSESMLHGAIYRQRKDVNAVFHGHSKLILRRAEKLNLVQTKQQEEYGTVALVKSVLAVLGNSDFIVMKNHGFLTLGETMPAAGERALNIINKIKT